MNKYLKIFVLQLCGSVSSVSRDIFVDDPSLYSEIFKITPDLFHAQDNSDIGCLPILSRQQPSCSPTGL